jgi:adenylate kinase
VAAYLHVPRISTGDMLRDAIAAGTTLGQQVGPLIEKGGLVPDELLVGVMKERLGRSDCANGYILDGFPRTLRQAEDFEAIDDSAGELVVFSVEVPRDELLRRLSGRRWCPQCQSTYHVYSNPPKQDGLCDKDAAALIQREDDKETAVARRLAEYDERTKPLIDYYKKRAHFYPVNGYRSVDAVFGDLKTVLEASR